MVVGGSVWLDEATTWAATALRGLGRRLVGPARQVRVRPWSTQVVLTATAHPDTVTAGTPVWLKQGCAALAHEGRVLSLIARIAPEVVDAPLAVDPVSGRFLTADHGPSMRDQGRDDAGSWCDVVALAARAQQQLLAHADALVAAGLPDGSPTTALERLEDLVEAGAHDDGGRTARLRRLRPAVRESAAALLDSPFPVTWNHGDLHPGNVAAGTASRPLQLFDLGDSDLSCAPEVLAVPRRAIADDAVWGEVLAAYCDAWGIDHAVGAALWPHVERVHAVNRTHAWSRALAEATPAEAQRWLPHRDHHLEQIGEPT
ncbi:hypothetical protein GCM10025875_19500 [Litorihabitans aurantiacus]|uniref:Phosphotransferase n=1 Tax=Litorihabitans aurantiacus TaxID=1930061 RepID=A0AA38CPU0_9MICO|nr:hypothetical protein GCM10025875_19500 [Litorihabitans aurantiacus]